MFVEISSYKCPSCGKKYDVCLGNVPGRDDLSTMIGPSVIQCQGCAKEIQTTRTEWAAMNTVQKQRAVVLTLMPAFILSAMTASFQSDTENRSKKFADVMFNGFGTMEYSAWFAGMFILIVGALFLKIRSSKARTKYSYVVNGESLWTPTLTFGAQLKFFIAWLFLLVWIILSKLGIA